ncbi:hypothetical protein HNR77_005350 [Paenibacillus sp. JGP012]|uniref:hypothetical protein n=1 Tax=Paenibacillus sp. JGP012 TaxID=2735914 RepID=UPI001609EA64|nr:hypothetical protein [Paenibacillus sp. JGP012]MBB6024242.1 hypothetical protein [Paenibacillus sp. JGP012]
MGKIGIFEVRHALLEIIKEFKTTSSDDFNELAYISATNKSELYLRDKLAIYFQKNYPELIVSREYLHKSGLLDDTNERYDIAILERVNNINVEPVLIIELKNWYCHDVPSKKVWNAVISDEMRVDLLSEKLGRLIDVIQIITFTHITNRVTDDLHNGIIKYQSFINDDVQKGKKKYPDEIDKYFNNWIQNDERDLVKIETGPGKYQRREIKNYFYVISKKN